MGIERSAWLSLSMGTALLFGAGHASAAIDPATGLNTADSSGFGFKYEMDVAPNNPSQIDLDGNSVADFLANTGPTAFNTGVAGSTDGFTATLDANRNPGANQILTGQGGSSSWDTTAFTGASGYTIEVRLKMVSTGKPLGINLDANINDGGGYSWLNIQNDGQDWGLSTLTDLGSNDNSDDFHTFRIAYILNDTTPEFWVWRDGVLLNPGGTSLAAGLGGNAKRVLFGSPSNSDYSGVAELDYLRFTNQALAPEAVPEPASLLLASCGLLALGRRRARG